MSAASSAFVLPQEARSRPFSCHLSLLRGKAGHRGTEPAEGTLGTIEGAGWGKLHVAPALAPGAPELGLEKRPCPGR
ncbi:unnamed protein product [Rangifer tarandus platyrhynchus]|uniref:Uncharacterized protein n=2 Tax=Rangifer tarandus platyrhynchus TaxID=3082113 RepID=A0ABN8ZPV1_RANTA|nr:unnamed protein product [Rangifer tarandus platyrhynchus]CAI9707018.1 unnamed protein product [Rangifer tarandus platyrhynchus]